MILLDKWPNLRYEKQKHCIEIMLNLFYQGGLHALLEKVKGDTQMTKVDFFLQKEYFYGAITDPSC